MLLYVSLLNIFLSILLMTKNWQVNRSTLFLGGMLVITSAYTIGYHFGVSVESRFWLAVFFGNLSPIWYLGGPCLYLYVRGTLQDRLSLKQTDLFHLVPALISLLGIFPYLFTPFQQKLELADAILADFSIARHLRPNRLIPHSANLLIRPSLFIAYSLASIRLVLRFESRYAHYRSIPKEQWKMVRNWILALSTTILIANIIALSISLYFNNGPTADMQMMQEDLVRQIYFQLLMPHGYVLALMPIAFLLFPKILYGIPIYRSPNREEGQTLVDGIEEPLSAVSESERSLPSKPNYAQGEKPVEDPFKELGDRLLQTMEQQKPYTDPEFSLDDLAELLDVPKHHLYYCFRNILHTKFTQLRMDFRIEHAKKLLVTSDLNSITLEAIGKGSGFASKSAFYTSFRNEVGCSPGEYAERHAPPIEGDNA
jgi:AraC-like DNA-binding protein